MSSLAQRIATCSVPKGTLALYWLCQAGFAFKTSSGRTVLIDPYFSDVVEREIGFKRMMQCPMQEHEVAADLVICTHEHLDHMDTDALPALARAHTHFAGPIECFKEFKRLGIAPDLCHLLCEGEALDMFGVGITPVFADHGDLAPDALGMVLDLDSIKIYHTGDTAYRPDGFAAAVKMRPDILLPCINGAFGNMDWSEAAQLVALVHPKVVIPTHFWMFVEQNGDPGRFRQECGRLAPAVDVQLLKPGEEFLFDPCK
jgi:L-ascorbate 6-phosphate lactonase